MEKNQIIDAYNKIAEIYHAKRCAPEGSGWNDYLEVPAMEKLLRPLVSGVKVLDLGCGTGLLCKEILKWDGCVCGVDQSEKMLELAKIELPHVNFYLSSADQLPLENESFGVVASSLVMHYIQDLDPVFSEVSRVLKSGGRFVFSMHHPLQETFNVDRKKVDGRPVMNSYFNNSSYTWKMCDQELLSFHHTFEDIIQSLCKADFVVRNLIECKPPEEAKDTFSGYEFTSQYPTFCVFLAEKV